MGGPVLDKGGRGPEPFRDPTLQRIRMARLFAIRLHRRSQTRKSVAIPGQLAAQLDQKGAFPS